MQMLGGKSRQITAMREGDRLPPPSRTSRSGAVQDRHGAAGAGLDGHIGLRYIAGGCISSLIGRGLNETRRSKTGIRRLARRGGQRPSTTAVSAKRSQFSGVHTIVVALVSQMVRCRSGSFCHLASFGTTCKSVMRLVRLGSALRGGWGCYDVDSRFSVRPRRERVSRL